MELEPQAFSKEKKLTKEARDSLKSFFHLLVGKPDSTQKIFQRPILVTIQSLIDLNERVQEKLHAHHIDGMVASVDVAFDDNTTIEFGSITEFEAYRWTTPKVTREIRMRWQFLLSIQGYELPQQHALAVKLSSDAKPIELLQALLSKHPGEDENAVISMAPLVCRVDFISPTVGQELIAVVGDWNEGLVCPVQPNRIVQIATTNKRLVESLISHTSPVLIALAAVSYLKSLFPPNTADQYLTVENATALMSWLMYSLILIYLSQKLAKALAQITITTAQKIGLHTIFSLTNGDENRRIQLMRANKRFFRRFVLSSAISFTLNMIAGICTALLWGGRT